jgi:hypothetical protein
MRATIDLGSFEKELAELRQDLLALGEQAARAAVPRALNRAATSGSAAISKAIVRDARIDSKHVKREIRIDKATRAKPVVSVTTKGRRIPLIAFDAKGDESVTGRSGAGKARRRGVSWRSPRDGSRQRNQHAFIASVASSKQRAQGVSHRGVFIVNKEAAKRRPARKHGQAQLPIVELHGPSVQHVFEKLLPTFMSAALASLKKNLRHEIDFASTKETKA